MRPTQAPVVSHLVIAATPRPCTHWAPRQPVRIVMLALSGEIAESS
jgi:hypothetical protein